MTIECFEKELYKIEDYLERSVIWQQLWLHVMDGKMSSLKYFKFVVAQLPHETIEQSLIETLGKLNQLINFYIPLDKV
jgi:hypothetical protein